jgi:hypothetical protein
MRTAQLTEQGEGGRKGKKEVVSVDVDVTLFHTIYLIRMYKVFNTFFRDKPRDFIHCQSIIHYLQ